MNILSAENKVHSSENEVLEIKTCKKWSAGRTLGILIRVLLVTAFIAYAVSARRAQAETYKEITPKVQKRSSSILKSAVMKVLKSKANFDDPALNKKYIQYFKEYLFPNMTLTKPANLAELEKHRKELATHIRTAILAGNATTFHHLTGLTFDSMKPILEGNYHPAARYNAVLIIGTLDKTPGTQRGANIKPPVPLPAATDYLIKVLQSKAPGYLKNGAMVGLQRHATYNGISVKQQKILVPVLLALLQEKNRDGVKPEVLAWFQTSAVGVLTTLKSLGDNNAVHNAIIAGIADTNRPVRNRCREAKMLSAFKDLYKANPRIDGDAAAKAIAKLARDIAKEEVKTAEAFIDLKAGDGFAQGGFEEEVVTYNRESIAYRTWALAIGMNSLAPTLPESAKDSINTIKAAFKTINGAAVDKKSLDIEFARLIQNEMENVITAADSIAPPPAKPSKPTQSAEGSDSREPAIVSP